MKASELIARLQELVALEGDLEVGTENKGFYPEEGGAHPIDEVNVKDADASVIAEQQQFGPRFFELF